MEHMKLLCDFSEINWVFADSASIETFLQKIVTMVAKHMQAHVSSIYLYDEAEHELTLRATQGLNPDAVNRVKLRLGEGITGLALKELRPVTQRGGEVHPNFKAIPGIFEENFESFLAVPIVRGVSRVGVLTAQRVRERNFTDEDVMAMRAIASQLANILENAKLLMGLEGKLLSPTREESSLGPEVPQREESRSGIRVCSHQGGRPRAGAFLFVSTRDSRRVRTRRFPPCAVRNGTTAFHAPDRNRGEAVGRRLFDLYLSLADLEGPEICWSHRGDDRGGDQPP